MAGNILLSTKNPFYCFLSRKATQHACILNAPMNVLPQGEVEEFTLKCSLSGELDSNTPFIEVYKQFQENLISNEHPGGGKLTFPCSPLPHP